MEAGFGPSVERQLKWLCESIVGQFVTIRVLEPAPLIRAFLAMIFKGLSGHGIK